MPETIWTKHAKEGFGNETNTPNNENVSSDAVKVASDSIANFGNDVFIGKDPDELILRNDPNTPLPTETPAPTTDASGSSVNYYATKVSNLIQNANITGAKELYVDGVKYLKKTLDTAPSSFATPMVMSVHENPASPEAQDDLKILKAQLSNWITIVPVTYLMVINWWYIMCYTNFSIDFRKFISPGAKWILAPAFYSFELLNYYTLTFRMDKESKYPTIDTSRKLWNLRPIVFSLFHAITIGVMYAFPATDIVESTLTNTGYAYILMCVIAFYYYFVMLTSTWIGEITSMVQGIMLIFPLIAVALSSLAIFVVLTILTPLFMFYNMFLSYFVIFAFNYFWPPKIWSVYKQIFQELKEIPVDEPIDKLGKLKNAILQNFHSLYLLGIVCWILYTHITASMSFANQTLMIIAIVANIVMAYVFAPSSFSIPFVLFSIFAEKTEEDAPVSPPES